MLKSITTAAAKILTGKKSASAPPEKTAPRVLVTWAVPVKNPRIVIAYVPGTDPTNPTNLVTVRVRDNRMFMTKMGLPVNQTGDKEFDLVGRLPRWKGDKLI